MSIKKLKRGWQISYYDANRRRKRKSYKDKATAKRMYGELSGQYAPGERSLRDMLEFHLHRGMLHCQEHTKVNWLRRARPFVEWCEGRGMIYASHVTREAALEYAAFCVKTRKGKGIEHRLVAASTLFKSELELRDEPAITRNPFKSVRKGGYYRKRAPKLIPREQLTAFLASCPEMEYHLFRLSYGGGLRVSEPRNLRWKHVGTSGLLLGDEEWLPKTEESQNIIRYNTIMEESLAWFRKRTGNKTFVLDSETFKEHGSVPGKIKGQVGINFIDRRFKRVLDIARTNFPEFEWENFTPHKLRAAYIQHLIELGVEPAFVQRLARHRRYATTDEWYVNIGAGPLNEAARRLDTFTDTKK